MTENSRLASGWVYAVVAYVFWGTATIFWDLFNDSDPVALLCLRVLSTLVFLAGVHTLRRSWSFLPSLMKHSAELRRTVLRAALITVNWGVFLYAVTSGHVVDASLGYFISPLMTVTLGLIFLQERLRRPQWVAIVVAAGGVTWIAVRAGDQLWLSLVIGATFAYYGLVKKRSEATSVDGLTSEVMMMTPLALVGLAVWSFDLDEFTGGAQITGLIFAGAVTAFPLLLFAAATKRADLSVVGFTQYLTPTIMFTAGLVVFGESVSAPLLQGFVLIWISLAIFTIGTTRGAMTSGSRECEDAFSPFAHLSTPNSKSDD